MTRCRRQNPEFRIQNSESSPRSIPVNLSWIAPASSLSRSAPSCSASGLSSSKSMRSSRRAMPRPTKRPERKASSQPTSSNAVPPALNATATAALPVFDTNAPEAIAGHHQCPRPLHVHFARRRIEVGGIAGLSRNRLAALEKEGGEGRRGHAEPARARAGAGDFGRCQPGRRRQFHPDPNRRWRSRGKIPHQRPAAREGIPSQFELSGERERAAGKRFGPTARAARAGMGHWHGNAHGAG